jgi:hypothetical protein
MQVPSLDRPDAFLHVKLRPLSRAYLISQKEREKKPQHQSGEMMSLLNNVDT